jgi:hypothetical protein
MPARRNFGIIARHNGLVVVGGFILPHRALAWPYNAGVSDLASTIFIALASHLLQNLH